MKISLLVILFGLAISLPVFAQLKDAVDPQRLEQLDTLVAKYAEAVNGNNATAVAALFTKNAVFVSDTGPVYGPEGVEKWFAAMFKLRQTNYLLKVDPDSPHLIGKGSNALWSSGEWSATVQIPTGTSITTNGFWSAIYVWEADAWMYRMLTFNRIYRPPVPMPSPITPSIN
jgi:ketosteroid isomerase-like protein